MSDLKKKKPKGMSSKEWRKINKQALEKPAIVDIKSATDTEQQLPDGVVLVEADTDVVEMETSLAAQYAVEDALEMAAVEEVVTAASCDTSAYIEKQFAAPPVAQSKPSGKLSLAEVMAARSSAAKPVVQAAPVKVETHIPRLPPVTKQNVVHQLPTPTTPVQQARVVQLTPVTERDVVSVVLPEQEQSEPQFFRVGGVDMPTGRQDGIIVYAGGMNTAMLITNPIQPDGEFKTRVFHTFDVDETTSAVIDEAVNKGTIAIVPVNFEYGEQFNRTSIDNLTTASIKSELNTLAEHIEAKIINMGMFTLHEGQYRAGVSQFDLSDIVVQTFKSFDKYEDAIETYETFDLPTILSLIYSDDKLRSCVITTVVNKTTHKCSLLCLYPVKSV